MKGMSALGEGRTDVTHHDSLPSLCHLCQVVRKANCNVSRRLPQMKPRAPLTTQKRRCAQRIPQARAGLLGLNGHECPAPQEHSQASTNATQLLHSHRI